MPTSTTAMVRRTMGVGGLNDDVWTMVLEELSSMTREESTHLLAAMRTCSTLHKLGIKPLLDRDVVLDELATVISFCHFLAANNYSRAHLWRSLVLKPFPMSTTTSTALCSAMRHAIRLRKLTICGFDRLRDHVPEIIDILANMRQIRKLKVEAREPTTALIGFLDTFRSNLTSVSIWEDQETKIHSHGSTPRAFNLLKHLRLSHSTLRSVCVHHLDMTGCDGIVLPEVRYLEAVAVSRIPPTDVLVRAFPKLTRLSLSGAVKYKANNHDAYVHRREANIQAQNQRGKWTRLESVSGSMVDVFSLGLTCPLSWIFVYAERMSPDASRRMLQTLLESAPKLPNLGFLTKEDIFGLGSDYSRMEYERERVEKTPGEREWLAKRTELSIRTIFDGYSDVLRDSACTLEQIYMRIEIPCILCDYWDCEDDDPEDLFTDCPILKQLRSHNLFDETSLLLQTVPTLQDIELRLMHNIEEVQILTRMVPPHQ
ncbi:hypothetical protein K466DRAFT_665733 [Polyporus arcularius HHB13444]|uniref:F-box domain-containing protein n=1 Tax=Polyporus arcularius HHB13444 TaxID=1314778 RepID=A0A5C3P3L4_9APHY|nr:hypothetical protein K466DRAFT_665733 [Polyporus arcularius HHB13444]